MLRVNVDNRGPWREIVVVQRKLKASTKIKANVHIHCSVLMIDIQSKYLTSKQRQLDRAAESNNRELEDQTSTN
jgi:hypothetical protein